jgi:hypothetical protein
MCRSLHSNRNLLYPLVVNSAVYHKEGLGPPRMFLIAHRGALIADTLEEVHTASFEERSE